jgi:hypothetical protein
LTAIDQTIAHDVNSKDRPPVTAAERCSAERVKRTLCWTPVGSQLISRLVRSFDANCRHASSTWIIKPLAARQVFVPERGFPGRVEAYALHDGAVIPAQFRYAIAGAYGAPGGV